MTDPAPSVPAPRLLLLRADHVAPIDRPPLRDAAIVIDEAGRIAAVGDAATLRRAFPKAEDQDLGHALLVPGLVNAHTHLELSGVACGEAPASFTDWILSLAPRLGRDTLAPEEIFPPAVRQGVAQCLRFGVTCVGDISQHVHLIRPILRDGPLRCVSFGEAIGIGANRPKLQERLARALERSHQSPWLRIGLSPHAPYSVERPDFERVLRLAREHHLPLATHLAELPYERQFLEHHAGPFRELLEVLGIWRDDIETYPASPIRFAAAIGLLDDAPTLLAHVNYCNDEELDVLSRGRASVVYCPRTHRYFGHPLHRWREMLARGINVVLGTDSCASSPDLNLLDDARLAHAIAPDVPLRTLWEMITIRGARAMGMEDEVGSLTVGKHADVVAFEVRGSDDPLRAVLKERPATPSSVWIAGVRVR